MPDIPPSRVPLASRPAAAPSLPAPTGLSSSSGPVLHPPLSHPARVSAPAHVPASAGISISAARPDTAAQVEHTPKTARHLLHGNGVRSFPLDEAPIAPPLEPHERKLVGHALEGPVVGQCKIAHNADGTTTLTYRVEAVRPLPRLVVTLCIDGPKPVRVELETAGGCRLDVRCEQWRSNDDWLEECLPTLQPTRSYATRVLKSLGDQRLYLWSLGLQSSIHYKYTRWKESPASLKALIQSMASARDDNGARVRAVLKNEGVTAATALSDEQAVNVLYALAEPDEQGEVFIKGLSANDLRWLKPLHNAPLLRAAAPKNNAISSVRTFLNEQVIKHSARAGTGHPYPHDITGTSERADQTETPELRHMLQAFLQWLGKLEERSPNKPRIARSLLRRLGAARSTCDPMHSAFDLKERLPFKKRLNGQAAAKASKTAPGSNDAFDTATSDWLQALGLSKAQQGYLINGLSQFLDQQFKRVCEPRAVREVLKAWEGIAAAANNTALDPRDHVLKPPKAIRPWSPPLRLDVFRLHLLLQQRIRQGSLLPQTAGTRLAKYARLAAALQAHPLGDMMAAAAHQEKFKRLTPGERQEVQRLLDGSAALANRRGSVLQLFHRLPWQAQALWIEALPLKPTDQASFFTVMVQAQGGRWYLQVPERYTSPLQPVRALQDLVKQMPPQWDKDSDRLSHAYHTLLHRSDARWVPGQPPALIQALRLAKADRDEPGFGEGFMAALSHLQAQLGLDSNNHLKQVLRDLLALPGLDAVLADEPLQPQLQANDERLQDVLGQLQAAQAAAHVVHRAQELLGVWMRWRERGPKLTPNSPPVQRTAANPCDNLVEQALRAHGTLQSFMEEVQTDLRHLREDTSERRDALWTRLQPLGGASAGVDDDGERAALDRQLQACTLQLDVVSSAKGLVEQAFHTLYEQAQPLRDEEQQVQQAEKTDREASAQQQPDPAAPQAAEQDQEEHAQADAQDEDEDEANAAEADFDDIDWDQWLHTSDLSATAAS